MRLYRYRIPLREPLYIGGQRLEVREGLLIEHTEAGDLRWGEAAPLPGFSRETLSDVIAAACKQRWHSHPSLRFALASTTEEPVSVQVPMNGLIVGDRAAVQRQIVAGATADYRSVKLKVGGPHGWRADAELVRDVLRSLRPDQQLRLDANRRWTRADAESFCDDIASPQIEYIEEPTACPAEFESIASATGIRYALDETLRESFEPLSFPNAAAWIIKPTLQGWPDEHLLQQATVRAIPLVFSSCFESDIGLANVARLAHRYSGGIDAGLDTLRWWSERILVPPPDCCHGRFCVPATGHVDRTWLTELDP